LACGVSSWRWLTWKRRTAVAWYEVTRLDTAPCSESARFVTAAAREDAARAVRQRGRAFYCVLQAVGIEARAGFIRAGQLGRRQRRQLQLAQAVRSRLPDFSSGFIGIVFVGRKTNYCTSSAPQRCCRRWILSRAPSKLLVSLLGGLFAQNLSRLPFSLRKLDELAALPLRMSLCRIEKIR
jgi:hypothetical protein